MSIDVAIRRLLNFFIVMFVGITLMLVYWQVAQAHDLSASAYNPRHCTVGAIPKRGSIFDRNGVMLAYSEVDPKSVCGWRRHYATAQHPSISSIVGYFSYTYGATGIEQYYNDVLNGTTDPQNFDNAFNQYWNGLLHRPVFGSDIYLTIDVRIQDEIDKVFPNQVTGGVCTSGSDKGSIVVSDPRTGEMLGMVSKPYFDADRIGNTAPSTDDPTMTDGDAYWKTISTDNVNTPLVNRAIQGQYAPGSSFKTLTLIAALDSGTYSSSSTFNQADASNYVVNGFHVDSNNLIDYAQGPVPPFFPMDLAHAYAYSDNVVFARVGNKIGASTWLDYARRFYLSTPDQKLDNPIDYAPTSRNYIYKTGTLDPVSLAVSAYGQGQLGVSPLTMTMISNAVADGGLLAQPHFLQKVVPHDANPGDIGTYDFGAPTRVFSGQTASVVQQSMRDVVTFGSVGASGGTIAAIRNSSAQIGGKTGTAQLGDGNPHAWFISIAPYNGNPSQMTTVIMKERGGEGACQAPIARQVFEFALPLK